MVDKSLKIDLRTETLPSSQDNREPLGKGIRVIQQGPLRANSSNIKNYNKTLGINHHRDVRALSPSSGSHRVLNKIRGHGAHSRSQQGLNSPLGVVIVDLVGLEVHNSPDHRVYRFIPMDHATLMVAWVT